jgi:hypothetical protein
VLKGCRGRKFSALKTRRIVCMDEWKEWKIGKMDVWKKCQELIEWFYCSIVKWLFGSTEIIGVIWCFCVLVAEMVW